MTAWKALKILLSNPEDTSQVFTIIRSLSGKSLVRAYNRFAVTQTGAKILAERRNLLTTLQNREALAALPPASLGRAYLKFVESQNLTADGLVDASEGQDWDSTWLSSDGLALYTTRIRDMHDLWHVVSGYGRDEIGEICLLGFTYAQTRNPGIAFIAIAGALKQARLVDPNVLRALWAGYLAGRRAAWLPAADWEQLLGMPLESVRDQLGLSDPQVYPALVSQTA